MASSSPVRHAWRVLIGLFLVTAALFGLNATGVHVFKESSWAPELALDLQGGTQIVLSGVTDDGANPTQEQLDQAVAIIRQRVDAAGVSEPDITTEGTRNIVVQLPGAVDDETRARIEASAQMELRAVLVVAPGVAETELEDPAVDEEGASVDDTVIGEGAEPAEGDAPAEDATSDDAATEEAATDDAAADDEAVPGDDADSGETPAPTPTDASDLAWITDELWAEFLAYDCAAPTGDERSAPAAQPLITCDDFGLQKYILGPVESREIDGATVWLDGSTIDDAVATRDQAGQWIVQLSFDNHGRTLFGEVSQRLYDFRVQDMSPRDQFAFVLDGAVISAPRMIGVILTGQPSITGNFTQETATLLADQLRYGALPLSFNVETSETISATLGSQQLQIGLIAGLIGLGLVALYSLLSYRTLGVVIVASLAVMAVLTYIIIAILAWRIGFRLSLAGVAGLIVAIGFCADSFIVYFERIRDEMRDGKGVTVAVEDGWARAKRTIYISKSINVLAAVVLYILADSTVKGFAFTLGLTTILDVIIFVAFTHPVMQLLARTKFFGRGHPLSGMDPEALGAVFHTRTEYRRTVATGSEGKSARAGRSQREAEKRQTIAERKRAEALNASASGKDGDA